MAATVRRMQRDRDPRILVYDREGLSRLMQPEPRGSDRVHEPCNRMVELVNREEA